MISSILVINQEYSVDNFVKAIEADPKKFQPGAVLEISTEAQLINADDQCQKVIFVFLQWYVKSLIPSLDYEVAEFSLVNYSDNFSDRIVGISGARSGEEVPIKYSLAFSQYPNRNICCFRTTYLKTNQIAAKKIKYVAENIIFFALPNMPIDIATLIWHYT